MTNQNPLSLNILRRAKLSIGDIENTEIRKSFARMLTFPETRHHIGFQYKKIFN